MFKIFFKNIHSSFKKTCKQIRNSKIMKFAKAVLKGIGIGSIVVTAFNAGNISEALTHMVDGPSTVMDAIRWMGVMCGNMITDIKAKNITWEIKRIFAPAVTAIAYIGSKIVKKIHSIMKWFRNASSAMKKVNVPHNSTKKNNDTDVVNLFA